MCIREVKTYVLQDINFINHSNHDSHVHQKSPHLMAKAEKYNASIARIFRTVSHMCASINLFANSESWHYYSHFFGALSDGLKIISIMNKKEFFDKRTTSDLAIHGSAFLFKILTCLQPKGTLSKISALAGMIHAFLMIQRLLPPDQEYVKATIPIGKLKDDQSIEITAVLDRKPKSLQNRLMRWFERVELCEKIAELVDESFHFFNPILSACVASKVYNTLHRWHHTAHDIEHILHAHCIIGDILDYSYGNYFKKW